MLKKYKTVRKIAREIAGAADGAFDSYRDGSVVEEPHVTDSEERVRNLRLGGVLWTARTLRTGRGVAAEEK